MWLILGEMAKVLLVEDDEGVAESTASILELEGYEVACANSGESAREAFAKYNPDVLVVDLLLGDENGGDLVAEFKKKSKVPAIMLSAHPTAEAQAKAAGADEFLAKPFDIDELLLKIKTLTT